MTDSSSAEALGRRFAVWTTGKRKRSRIQKDKSAGIAKILIGESDDHAGMGIVIDPRHVITCAHVVNVALGQQMEGQERPTGSLRVSFPMLGEASTIQASVVEWRAPGPEQRDDIAVLKLYALAPKEAGVAMLADVTGMSTDGDALSVFGVEEGNRIGNHIDARFKGSNSAAWVQIDDADRDGAFVEGGFSGAAVWDYPHAAVLGMMVAKRLSAKQRAAYMIPAADLQDLWPALQLEHRSLPASFARTWTAFSALFFVALVAHWAVNRGVSTLAPITLSGNHPQLASFWGMNLYAIFAPFLLPMLIVFARSFRLHDWAQRVPSFGAVRGRPVSSSTWWSTALGLFAFIVMPLIAQIHFLRNFHDEGYVYIYPTAFGYQRDDPAFVTERCYRDDVSLCTKREAGRYSLAMPAPGTEAPYWDNAYHFGDLDRPNGTVTFFPIYQPVLVIALTVFSAALSAFVLFLVLRPSPDWFMRRAEEGRQTMRGNPSGSSLP